LNRARKIVTSSTACRVRDRCTVAFYVPAESTEMYFIPCFYEGKEILGYKMEKYQDLNANF
jgi:hypothetical protein